jgi:hypothetical protein
MADGIDFLLGHPDLKPSDIELGVFLLRQTLLFGKDNDKSTSRQQACGVLNLNRGTGRHPKTLQHARSRLRKAGFMRVLGGPGDRRGNCYAPDFEFIERQVAQIRMPKQIAPPHPGANCSPHQSYPAGSNGQSENTSSASGPGLCEQKPPERTSNSIQERQEPKRNGDRAPWRERASTISAQEGEQMRVLLVKVASLYPHLGPLALMTARHMFAAAKLSRENLGLDSSDITPDDVFLFLASKLPPPQGGWLRSFGGLLVAVYEDFGGSIDQLRARVEEARCADELAQARRLERQREEQSAAEQARKHAAELKRAESERQVGLRTPMRPEDAIAAAGCQRPPMLCSRLIRIGLPISPAEVIEQVSSWTVCPSCGDTGITGDPLLRTSAFCSCVAGEEMQYQDPSLPERETDRVHATPKTRLVAALRRRGHDFPADAMEESDVQDDDETLQIFVPYERRFSIGRRDVEEALHYLREPRKLVFTIREKVRQPSGPLEHAVPLARR